MKMRMRASGLTVLAVLAAAFVLPWIAAGCSEEDLPVEKPTDEQVAAFRAAKSVKIKVDDRSKGPAKDKLKFEATAKEILDQVGLQPRTGMEVGGDATLTVKAKGEPKDGKSMVRGTITLKAGSAPPISRSFHGETFKPHLNKYYAKIKAVYFDDEVIFETGSFTPVLLQLLADLYGPELSTNVLRAENKNIRRAGALALGATKDGAVVNSLLRLFHDKEPIVKEAAVAALVMVGEPAVAPLKEALKDRDMIVRRRAAVALIQIGDPGSMETWVDALRDEDPAVKKAAAEALVKAGPAVVDQLIAGLGDKDKYFRRDVAGVLGGIKDPKALAPLMAQWKDIDFNLAKDAANAVAAYGEACIPAVTAAAKDKSAPMRKYAVYTLGVMKHAPSLDLMLSLAKDKDIEVRAAAITALATLGDPRGIAVVKEAVKDKAPLVAHTAEDALAKLPPAPTAAPAK